eukprot:7384648-Prymnesium_polylepis.1
MGRAVGVNGQGGRYEWEGLAELEAGSGWLGGVCGARMGLRGCGSAPIADLGCAACTATLHSHATRLCHTRLHGTAAETTRLRAPHGSHSKPRSPMATPDAPLHTPTRPSRQPLEAVVVDVARRYLVDLVRRLPLGD